MTTQIATPVPLSAFTFIPRWPSEWLNREFYRIMPHRRRRGGGITDIIIAAVVVIVVVAALFGLSQIAFRMINDSRLNSMITRTMSVIERTYANTINYPSGNLIPSLAVSGVFNENEIQKVGTSYVFVSPYGGDISVTGSGSRTYSIQLLLLPRNACATLVSNFVTESTPLQNLSINGSTLSKPYSQPAVDAACDNTTNTVILTFI